MSAEIEVKHVDRLNGSPAAQLAVAGWMDVVSRDLGEPGGVLNMADSQKAFIGLVMNGREQLPVGVLSYFTVDHHSTLWLMQAYVVEEFRGRGIYTAMFDAAIAKAAELGLDRVQLATHMRNTAMREIAKRHHGAETAVIVTFEVPKV